MEANQTVIVEYAKANKAKQNKKQDDPIFKEVDLFEFTHQENDYDDFKREVLLPHAMSSLGPGLSVRDFNGDQYEDLIATGAKDQTSQVFYGSSNGTFQAVNLENTLHEDVGAITTDLDKNGVLDIVLASGGNEANDLTDDYYKQRIYFNGSTSPEYVSDIRLSASKVLVADLNQNGDKELYYFGRQVPGQYPSPASAYVVEYANGNWQDLTQAIAPGFNQLGMVTDAVFSDKDGDGDQDLLVVGEWMGLMWFENENGRLKKANTKGISDQIGWWSKICAADFDQDGDEDYVVFNLGLNYKYKAKNNETFDCYANDFDQNKDIDIVLGYYQKGEQYPVRGRQCSAEQIPSLTKKFHNYHTFALASLQDIYPEQELKSGIHYKANNFAHVYLENKGNGFDLHTLPFDFQASSINAAVPFDVNQDGHLDMVIAGNIFDSEVETPRSDAEFGSIAFGDGKGNFRKSSFKESGLYIPYECRSIVQLNSNGKSYFVFGNNNEAVKIYELNF